MPYDLLGQVVGYYRQTHGEQFARELARLINHYKGDK